MSKTKETKEIELQSKSKEAENTSAKQPKTKKPFFKRKLVRIGCIILFLLLIGGGIVIYLEYKRQKPHSYSPPYPEKSSLSGQIIQVYDGDTSRTPRISIFNRIVKIKLKLTSNNIRSINLNDINQISLYSGGKSFSPVEFEAINIGGYENIERDFYFELNRTFKPEVVVIIDDDLYNNLEIPIDIEADYYSRNENLKLVFDDEANREFAELVEMLNDLAEGRTSMKETPLPNIDLIVSLPDNSNSNATYLKTTTETDPYDSGDYYISPYCKELNPETLKPSDTDTLCKSYRISYEVYTESKYLGTGDNFEIYYNSYPKSLIDILSSHSDEHVQSF